MGMTCSLRVQPIGPFGTRENPVIVESIYEERIMGCPGGCASGDTESFNELRCAACFVSVSVSVSGGVSVVVSVGGSDCEACQSPSPLPSFVLTAFHAVPSLHQVLPSRLGFRAKSDRCALR
eukprot:1761027-Rhodomonas_salina.2